MSMKLKLSLLLTALIIIVVAVGVIIAIQPIANKDLSVTQPIPVGSTLSVAKTHSGRGVLPACLTNSNAAETNVRADDYLINGKDSAFDLATTMGIIDVPAGTQVDAFVHSYDGKNVTGSIKYAKNYGTYNFRIVPNTTSKPYQQWNMTSLIACR